MARKKVADLLSRKRAAVPAAATLLESLPTAVIVVDSDTEIRYVNPEAEQLFAASAGVLLGKHLQTLIAADSPLYTVIGQALSGHSTVSETGVTLRSPKFGDLFVSLQAAVVADDPDCVVLTIQEQSISRIIDRQMTYRSAARSVSAMSSVMAHEIKNPLSGIRGAAQLLETGVDDESKELTRLICEETDRIVNLIDRMDIFADSSPAQYEAVNLHEVLGHVRKLAENGFAKHVRFVETYDPSLPMTLGDRDRLIQAFLNLVKNASEAVPRENGEIQLSTAYRHGVRLAMPGRSARVHLPLVVTVQDNGEGIPPDIQSHLFDPFVTSKSTGTGLGLAVVAKVVNDHGGVVEFDSSPRRTAFRIMLPMHQEAAVDEEGGNE